MSDEMRVSYIVPRDMVLRAMSDRNAGGRRVDWGMAAILVILICAFVVIAPVIESSGGIWAAFVAGLLLGGIGHWLRTSRVQRRAIRSVLDAHDRAGRRTLAAGPDGVRVETAMSLTSMRWAAIDRIGELEDATLLWSGATVLPVPDAALPRGMAADTFRARLATWRTS